MRLYFSGALAALALCACATTPAQVHYDAGTALLAGETALDVAEKAALVAVTSGATTKAQAATIAALTAPCPAGVPPSPAACPVNGTLALARQAYAASDQASWPGLIAAMAALTAQLVAAHR